LFPSAIGRLVQILTVGRSVPKPPEQPERPKLKLADIQRVLRERAEIAAEGE
jgi:hypothetical protein